MELDVPALTQTDGGSDVAEINAQVQRIRDQIAAVSDGAVDLGEIGDDILGDVDDLLNALNQFECLAGLGRAFFGLPAARSKVPRLFGGFDAAALVPLLKDILAGGADRLGQLVNQSCHQRAIEANTGASVELQRALIRSVHADGSQIFFEGTPGRSARLDYEDFVDQQVTGRGSPGELLAELVAVVAGGHEAQLRATEAMFGTSGDLYEIAEPATIEYGGWDNIAFSGRDCDDHGQVGHCLSGLSVGAIVTGALGDALAAECRSWHAGVIAGDIGHLNNLRRQWRNGLGDQYGAFVRRLHSNPAIVHQFDCRARNRIGVQGGGGVRVEDDPALEEFYAFDERNVDGARAFVELGQCSDREYGTEADCEDAGETWVPGMLEEPDYGADAVLTAADVEARSNPVAPQVGHEGTCSETEALTELDCYALRGTWTQGAVRRGRLAQDCYAALPDPVGEDAEGLSGAFRKLRSYNRERLRQSELGDWLCSMTPSPKPNPEAVCFPRTDRPLLTRPLPVKRMCLTGPDAPAVLAAMMIALNAAVLGLAGLAVYGQWIG